MKEYDKDFAKGLGAILMGLIGVFLFASYMALIRADTPPKEDVTCVEKITQTKKEKED